MQRCSGTARENFALTESSLLSRGTRILSGPPAQGAQAVAKEQGATSLTIQAVAVANPRLASLLLKQGFTETTIKVGKETVKAFVKTIKVQ
jgi:hypothetical protein